MSIAEIYGKISQTGSNLHERLEDMLTSDVFGTFKYTDPNIILYKFLSKSINIHNNTLELKRITKIEYIFWPRLENCEPDLMLEITDEENNYIVIFIEAKYLSGKSSSVLDEDELKIAHTPSDQLAREYQDLFNYYPSSIKYLIYVTAHRTFPKDLIYETNNEISRVLNANSENNIFWNNWFNITSLLKEVDFSSEVNTNNLIYEDLKKLLIRKGLYYYTGLKLYNIEKIYYFYLPKYVVDKEPLSNLKPLNRINVFYTRLEQNQSLLEVKSIILINKFYIGGNNE